MLIDTHSHLNFRAFDNDRDEVIKRTQKEEVVCIDVGTKYQTSKKAVELAQTYQNIFAAIGLHPIHIKTDLLKIRMAPEEGAFQPLREEFKQEKYLALVKFNKVVAIGEIGLDYYYKPKTKAKFEQFKEKQKEIFLLQLDLARKFNLPVILHCRMAHEEMIKILESQIALSYKKIKGVIHCFTGTPEEMEQYLNMGFYVGINGIIFKLDLDEAIRRCPLDRILIETDCPYLTPPKQGNKRNEPIFVKYIAQRVAEIKNMSYEKVIAATTKNAQKLFNIHEKI